jgi:hypothetical protein
MKERERRLATEVFILRLRTVHIAVTPIFLWDTHSVVIARVAGPLSIFTL